MKDVYDRTQDNHREPFRFFRVHKSPTKAALLVIDLQNYCSHRQGGQHKDDQSDNEETRYYWNQLDTVVPNVKRLQEACREKGAEVLFTVRATEPIHTGASRCVTIQRHIPAQSLSATGKP